MTLLHSGSGTSTAAGATNVDTVAISGLTTLDSLLVVMSFSQIVAASGTMFLYNSTDSVNVWGSTAAGQGLSNAVANWGATAVAIRLADAAGLKLVAASGVVDAGAVSAANTFTTNYTGSWTLALRIAGTSGTIKWNWAVYKVTGQ
jgi:hypothetical protein